MKFAACLALTVLAAGCSSLPTGYNENGYNPAHSFAIKGTTYLLDGSDRIRVLPVDQNLWVTLKIAQMLPLVEDIKRSLLQIQKDPDFASAEKARLRGRYEGFIRGLRPEDGELLCRLIESETGETALSLLRKYDGRAEAMVWNQIAASNHVNLDAVHTVTDLSVTAAIRGAPTITHESFRIILANAKD